MAITAQVKGQLVNAKCATFKDEDGKVQTYGKIQVLVPDNSGDFLDIQNIKVAKEYFGQLPDLQKQLGKVVEIDLEAREFRGKTNYYFMPRETFLPQQKKAS